ncbi:MAG: hypothetical protein AAFR17_10135 [Pseudomonadota bacterium]
MTDPKTPTEIDDKALDDVPGGVASTASSNPEGLRRPGKDIWTRVGNGVASSASTNPDGVASTASTNPEGVASTASSNPDG